MKKIYLFILCACLASLVSAQSNKLNQPNLSPLTKKFLHELKNRSLEDVSSTGYVYRKRADGSVFLSALIKVADPGLAEQKLEEINAAVGTKAGNIWTVQVPFLKVKEFTEIPGIAYIQLDEPVFPELQQARKTTRVDSVQRGINLPMRYSGKDVIVGVIDFGFDYNHPAFYDTLRSVYRIKRVWELNGVGTPPPGYIYGNEITDTVLIKAQGTDNPAQKHGTATASIAAGSGYGTPNNNNCRGMAYDADLVFVGVRRDTIGVQWMQGSFSDFVDGVNYIFNYATSVGKPAVVNISWGSQSGPHDGTTLFNQACDNLSGPGKIIVMSAGNEGQEKIHLAKNFTPADSTLNTFLTFTPAVYKRTWVDVWGDTSKSFCAKVTLFSHGTPVNTTGLVCIDDLVHDRTVMASNGNDSCIVQFITSSAEFNMKPRMTIDVYNKSADSVGVTITGTDGAIDAWNEYYFFGYKYSYQSAFDNLGQPGAVKGDTVSTVSDMGAAQSVLLVGAYASKVSYSDINGNPWSYGGYVGTGMRVPFSSHGPMIDGRIKPDITAPGLTLATATSSYDTTSTVTGANSDAVVSYVFDAATNKTYYYAEFIGTSASAPCASGIIALMMQAYPALTPQLAKDIISTTAITDASTGAIPLAGNNHWGHGKINAYRAMKLLLLQTGMYEFSGEKLDCILFPNPNDGKFMIDYSGDRGAELMIEVFNMQGALINSERWNAAGGFSSHSLDISSFSKGAYVVKVSSAKGHVSMKTLVR